MQEEAKSKGGPCLAYLKWAKRYRQAVWNSNTNLWSRGDRVKPKVEGFDVPVTE